MTTKANIYANGKIYKIVNDDFPDEFYIGATTIKYLCKVLSSKNEFIKLAQKNKKTSSYEKLFNDNEDIILIENFPCNSKDELRARQQYHIDQNKDKCINSRTRKAGTADRDTKYIVLKDGSASGQFRYLGRTNCDVCNCTYTNGNAGHHKSTKKHIKNQEKHDTTFQKE